MTPIRDTGRTETDNSLSRQLRWLTFFRVITFSFLLGTTIVVQFRGGMDITDTAFAALYTLIGAVYFVTFLYALVLPKIVSEKIQAHFQITGDVLISTAVVYLTGGLDSAFSFMYILNIINAGILLKIRGAVMAASLSAILYGTLLDLHYYRYIKPFLTRYTHMEHYRAMDIINTILINMGAFYLVAFLSGYLSKQAEESRIKLAQRQSDLELLEEINESIVQSIDSGLMTLSYSGDILSMNPAAERIVGRRYNRLRGRPFTDVFPELVLPEVKNGQSPGAFWNWVYNRNDGQMLFLDMGLCGLMGHSGAGGFRLLVFQDKTDVRRMQEEVARVEKLALIGEMAAGIAHEIRNPLASISGSFQILESDLSEDKNHKRLLDIIQREMSRLNRIVNDFLLFARPKPPYPRSFDLAEVLENNVKMFAHQIEREGKIQISKDLLPELKVFFDQEQLEQVMWNLLRNAAEAMPQGGRLTVSTSYSDKYPQMGLLTIADEGTGIAMEDLPRIFDPFFTTKESGNGLGLSIVFRILEGGGGKIEAKANPDRGTRFLVYLPLNKRQTGNNHTSVD